MILKKSNIKKFCNFAILQFCNREHGHALPNFAKQNLGGQAMIVSVVLIGGILLSASAIAGLLVVYQIRQSNDMVNSAKAFFAADTGIEAVSMCYFKGCDDPATPVVEDATVPPQILFSNGARWETTSTIIAATPTTSSTLNIIAKGFSGNTIRILETQFEQ